MLNQMFYDSNAGLHCGRTPPANRTPGKDCDLACGGEPGLDLALSKLYGVPLAPDGVSSCWQKQGVACGGLPRSGFTFLVVHSNMFKGMALAAPPGSVVRPDVSDKSMCPKDPDFLPATGPDDFYQERILHYGLMGTDECELAAAEPARLRAHPERTPPGPARTRMADGGWSCVWSAQTSTLGRGGATSTARAR